MEQLIPVIGRIQDALQSVGSPQEIELPHIVVVGSQSSGKSSVLENIVGRDFLPRGTGIVTRRPLLLQLVHDDGPGASQARVAPKGRAFEFLFFLPPSPLRAHAPRRRVVRVPCVWHCPLTIWRACLLVLVLYTMRAACARADGEWGEFAHEPGRRFKDFGEIREEIQNETDRLMGRSKKVSASPIRLCIHSPNVLNLTLVDLPGITKVPVADQPADIEEQIRSIVLEYITPSKAIILAVSAATADIANSEALKIAKEVDPRGLRTIGVLTKLDLMDAGTDALDTLYGREVDLKLGFVAVCNRSQQDINNGLPIAEALRREQAFFARHPVYKDVAYRSGTAFLASTLNKILTYHIRQSLPAIRTKLAALIAKTNSELRTYGLPMQLDAIADGGAVLLATVTKFSSEYCAAIDGTSRDIATSHLAGGARISHIFHELFARCIKQISALDSLSLSDIRTVIRNATGPRRSLFVPEIAFELLVRRQIARLLEPCLHCVDLVFDELTRIANELETDALARFAVLRAEIQRVVSALLMRLKGPAAKLVTQVIDMELAYINTNHPDFVAGSDALRQLVDSGAAGPHAHHHETESGTASGPAAGAEYNATLHLMRTAQASRRRDDTFLTYFFGQEEPKAEAGTHAVGAAAGAAAADQTRAEPRERTVLPSPAASHTMPAVLRPGSYLSERERTEAKLITSLLTSYFDIVKKNVQDAVPKAVMLLLVNASKDAIHNELVASLYRPDMFASLLAEEQVVTERRAAAERLLGVLERASEEVSTIADWVDAVAVSAPASAPALGTLGAATEGAVQAGKAARRPASAVLGVRNV